MKKKYCLLLCLFSSLFSFAQPTAGYTKSASAGCVNTVVVFTSTSTGGVVEHFWEFGDGETSIEINPTHVYSTGGSKTITLTVTDGGGLTDVISTTYTVRPPVADFSISPRVSCSTPFTVFFTDESYLPDTWSWKFGDGSVSTAQNPIHNYITSGVFHVELTVSDTNNGCTSSFTDSILISDLQAEIGGPEFGYYDCAPYTVNFENGSTNPTAGTITSYLWDFGDGETSTDETPSHLYTAQGNYDVTLTITNDLGCTSVDAKPNFVTVVGPIIDFEGSDLSAECPDLTVTFTNHTFDSNPITGWAWDFGDGGTSALMNPTHTFTDYGSYTVTLSASDLAGCSGSESFPFYIVIDDPTPPAFDVCPGDQLESLSATCDFVLPDYTGLATVSDNCTDPLVISQSPVAGTLISTDQLITLTTTDETGNLATCTFTVFLEDNINPVITCPGDQFVSFDSDCAYTLLDYTALAFATDNCLSPTITQSPIAGTISTGIETITLTATDTAGNVATCAFDVIPSDVTAPTITCPAGITVNNDPGDCSAIVTYSTPLGLDNCSASTSLTEGFTSGSSFPIGTTTTSYSVTDGAGLTASCSFDITVIDTEAPSLICPSPIAQNNTIGECGAIITFSTPTLADNCPGATFSQLTGLVSGDFFPVGTTTNSFEAIDVAGNSVTCSFDVLVTDTENPTIICPAKIESCETTISYEDPVVNDNCEVSAWILSAGLVSGADFPIGVTTNLFEVTDIHGNSTTCSFTVERFETPIVNAGNDAITEAGFPVQFDASVSLPVTYSWSPSDGLSDPTVEDPFASPEMTTVYTLTVTSENGCYAADEVQLSVNLNIEINNFLSPNGDGKNDTWEIKGNYLLEQCTIKIIDSWGNLIYESQGYQNDWDGTIEGENAQQGNYFYSIDCGDGNPLTGSITLVR